MLVKNRGRGCLGVFIVWAASAAAVWLTAEFVPGVTIDNLWPAAFIAAFVIGLLNAFLRPLLLLLTLPINIITLGLFTVVVNAVVFWAGGGLLQGFHVAGFLPALMGAAVLSIVSTLLSMLLSKNDDE